jgi:hypothetical protein
MTKWNTAVGDTFISNTSLKLLTVSIPSPVLASEPFITDDENRETTFAHLLHFPPRTR